VARYRKIEVATWNDDRFRSMTCAAPNGQTLWLYLLSGPRTTSFPGLIVARDLVMASDLGWSVEAFRQAFVEASGKGLAKADWKAGLVVLRKALLDSTGEPRDTARPESPNVIKSWAKSWDEIPDCALKGEYLQSLGSFTKALGEGFHQAFREGFRKALVKASAHPSLNQDQEQKQDQKQEQEVSADAEPSAALAGFFDEVDAKSADRRKANKRGPKKPPHPNHAEGKAHWFGYWARKTSSGSPPTWAAKQAALLNGALTHHGIAEVKRRIDLLESSTDAWYQQWDFAAFAAHSDRLVASESAPQRGNNPTGIAMAELARLEREEMERQ
jgi:hypothetical protein